VTLTLAAVLAGANRLSCPFRARGELTPTEDKIGCPSVDARAKQLCAAVAAVAPYASSTRRTPLLATSRELLRAIMNALVAGAWRPGPGSIRPRRQARTGLDVRIREAQPVAAPNALPRRYPFAVATARAWSPAL